MPNLIILWSAIALTTFTRAALAGEPSLTFGRTLTVAEAVSSGLAAREAAVAAAQAAAVPADALPDPKLVVGIDNFPVSGPTGWAPGQENMAMARIGVQQDIPNTGKRQARADVARAGVQEATVRGDVERIAVRREAAVAWVNRFYVERRSALLDELERENKVFAQVVKAQVAGGKARAAEPVMPGEEAARLGDRRDELARDLAKAKAALRRWVGPAGDQVLAGDPPVTSIEPAAFRDQAASHPDLMLYEPMTRTADANLREAQAGKSPDWGVGVAYQRRAPQFGDMVSVQVTIDLPLFQASRQDPRILARRLELQRVAAEREDALRERQARLDEELAEYDALSRRLARMRDASIPLALERVKLETASYAGGRGEIAAVLAARREAIDRRIDALNLEGAKAALATRLAFTYGREPQ